MRDQLNITDSYGDEITLLPMSTGRLDITVTENPEDDAPAEACVILDEDQQSKLRDFLNGNGATLASHIENKRLTDPNEAKLRVAAQFGLRAKFLYKGEDDYAARERRVEPESVFSGRDGLLVNGESYDEDGEAEGYRQFYLSRIVGPVVVR